MRGEEGETTMVEKSPSSHDAMSSATKDSNQLEDIDGRSASPSSTKSANTPNRAKSCKGCLYYSSRFKADSRNPVCLGFTRSLPNAPRYIVGKAEMEASKEGRSLIDFRYACVGYSLYADRKELGSDDQQSQAQLPVCIGLEFIAEQRVNTADSASAPMAHMHNREDCNGLPQRSPKPTNSTGEEFLSRFARNAELVANGVAKNVRRIGNQIKGSLHDVLYPYRRPPK